MSDLVLRARELLAGLPCKEWTVAKWLDSLVLTEKWAQDELPPGERGPWVSIHAGDPKIAEWVAASPELVAGLLDENERLREALAYMVDSCTETPDDLGPYEAPGSYAIERARAVLAESTSDSTGEANE